MRERAALLRGEFRIHGEPGKGTTVMVSIPIPLPVNPLKPPMKILIADDHAVVRQGLKQILADAFKKVVFGEACNGQEALALVWNEKWDVAVLDITMPGRGGLEVLREIKKTRPNLPVLVLSMHPEDQFAMRILKDGASGYMTKESAPEELVGAIRKVLTGGRYVSPALAEKMVSYSRWMSARRPMSGFPTANFKSSA